MKPIKIVKGIVFLIIGVIFLFVTFYQVNDIAIKNGAELNLFNTIRFLADLDFSDFIIANSYNYLFSGLFGILGILELVDSVTIKKVGVKNGD